MYSAPKWADDCWLTVSWAMGLRSEKMVKRERERWHPRASLSAHSWTLSYMPIIHPSIRLLWYPIPHGPQLVFFSPATVLLLECPIMPIEHCCRRSKCVSNSSQEIDIGIPACPDNISPPIFDSVTIHALVLCYRLSIVYQQGSFTNYVGSEGGS